jgi:hypothetical protein
MTAARSTVLQTTELLTMILANLSPIDLLRSARQVSTAWNSLLTTSPTLRAKVFLTSHPSRGPDKWYVFDKLTRELYLCHYGDHILIKQLLPTEAVVTEWFSRQLSSRPTSLNPFFLRRTATGGMNRPLLARAEKCESLTLVSPHEAGLTSNPTQGWISLLKKEGVWGKMLLCQPGVDVVQAWVHYDIPRPKAGGGMTLRTLNTQRGSRGPIGVRRPSGSVRVTVCKPGGVTIGDFMREVVRVVGVLQGAKDVEVEIRTGEGRWGSVVWLLGAVMVSKEEAKVMEGRRVVEVL